MKYVWQDGEDADTTVEEPGKDYTDPKNYSVKRFVSHNITFSSKDAPPTITLTCSWKGYGDTVDQSVKEPWGKMKKFHLRQLKRYVNRNQDLKEIVNKYQLYNNLSSAKKKTKN